METKFGKTRLLKAQIGMRSLIGTGPERPVAFGNYFSLKSGEYVVNMWAENLEHWAKETRSQSVLAVVYPTGHALIVDDRLPPDYLTQLCFTGFRPPPVEILREMLAFTDERIDDFICGCEADDDAPCLAAWSMLEGPEDGEQEWVSYRRCSRCRRQWEVDRHPAAKNRELIGYTVYEELGMQIVNYIEDDPQLTPEGKEFVDEAVAYFDGMSDEELMGLVKLAEDEGDIAAYFDAMSDEELDELACDSEEPESTFVAEVAEHFRNLSPERIQELVEATKDWGDPTERPSLVFPPESFMKRLREVPPCYNIFPDFCKSMKVSGLLFLKETEKESLHHGPSLQDQH